MRFIKGVVVVLRSELEELHFDTRSVTDPLQLIQAYFTMARRLVPQQRYEVREAEGFTVPEDVRDGYELLKRKFLDGTDVTPHLHKAIVDTEGKDAMLFDWGIHHFHLGTIMDGDFIERTGNVLYAVINQSTVYAIGINQHGHWADKEMLDIINTNWPTLLNDYRLPAETQLTYVPTSEDIKKFRSGNINLFVQLSDGSCVKGRGGGLTACGSSAECMFQAINLRGCLLKVEDEILNKLNTFNVNQVAGKKGYGLDDLTEFYRDGNMIYVKTKDEAFSTPLIAIPPIAASPLR